jgi:hypothetical protein
LDDLIIVGKRKEKKTPHQKKVQMLNELIQMRMERKKYVKELMAKRAGTFHLKDNKL